jgi:hypothetical protein
VTVRSTAADKTRYDQNTRLGDLVDHPVGGVFVRAVMKQLRQQFGSYEEGSAEQQMTDNMVAEMPLRNLVRFAGGKLPPVVLDLLIGVLNGLQPFSVLERFLPK